MSSRRTVRLVGSRRPKISLNSAWTSHRASTDFPSSYSVLDEANQVTLRAKLHILEKDAQKGLAGLYVNFDRPSEKFPVVSLLHTATQASNRNIYQFSCPNKFANQALQQLDLSFSNGKPGVENTTANLTTDRPKIDGPLDRCPKFTALGYAVWN